MMMALVSENAETRAFLYADSFDAYDSFRSCPVLVQAKNALLGYHRLGQVLVPAFEETESIAQRQSDTAVATRRAGR